MDKRSYVKNLKSLQDTVNNQMLLEGPDIKGIAAQILTILKEKNLSPKETAKVLKDISKNVKLPKGLMKNLFSLVTKGTWKLFTTVGSVGGAVVGSLVSVPGMLAVPIALTIGGAYLTYEGLVNWRASSAMKKVKKLAMNANNANNYKESAKYIAALKKVQTKTGMWHFITTSKSAQNAAGGAIESIKKSYITCGVAMILVSAILCTIFALSTDIIKPLIESAKSLNWKGLCISALKLLALGVMALPAVLGILMIILALTNFPENGIVSDIVHVMSPIVKQSRQIVDDTLNGVISVIRG